ncbi:hypothetical protein [Ferrimonas gelatinilytica]|uniref:DNA methylase n=1 Tax=Ferrimonas gelatinilytica TaxID=1255257 RepID=A0ABP9RSY8_9GAMM
MHHYAILAHPGHQRIYLDNARAIALLELAAVCQGTGVTILPDDQMIPGLPASLSFTTEQPLNHKTLAALAASSPFFALFEQLPGPLLRPIAVPEIHRFPQSLSQILKYTGKTNEQFTRLMINLAQSACQTDSAKPRLLDPMCGKGTTLYEGMMRGFDVEGIEINSKWTLEIQAYIARFLKTGRYKHKITKEKRTGSDGKKLADLYCVETAADKADYAAGRTQQFRLFPADTRLADRLLKKNHCDLLVSDLPYGVQHGNKSAMDSKLDRSALTLLSEALPAWFKVLKPGGAMVLSFNEFTMKYREVAPLLEQNGFTVLDQAPYNGYLHRVDQSINRNLIVAVKA